MSKLNWKTYAFEFLSIFVAVISAFALTNWDDKRRDRHTEVKILTEIRNGLEKDIKDVQILLSYLWKIELNRNYVQRFYGDIEDKIKQAISAIENEIQD